MTKAAFCLTCNSLVSPSGRWAEGTDRPWTYCQCDHVAVRWRNGARGTLEVTALHGPEGVRVIGLNNAFLAAAVRAKDSDDAAHRQIHEITCGNAPGYLFASERRNCWALVVKVGESGDVMWVNYDEAYAHTRPPVRDVPQETAASDG